MEEKNVFEPFPVGRNSYAYSHVQVSKVKDQHNIKLNVQYTPPPVQLKGPIRPNQPIEPNTKDFFFQIGQKKKKNQLGPKTFFWELFSFRPTDQYEEIIFLNQPINTKK